MKSAWRYKGYIIEVTIVHGKVEIEIFQHGEIHTITLTLPLSGGKTPDQIAHEWIDDDMRMRTQINQMLEE